ncbi:uncharacterized protein LOC135211443 [Macrobrachium nipponense]|uniref:uncharacterized protein LOC135211443 n=1 Tax=Macrobrachium nipponense TaxID=159736 RepID=UPI0030C86A3C
MDYHLFAPMSQRYSLYIRPEHHHSESVQKRQADYTRDISSYEEGTEPIPEPEPTRRDGDHSGTESDRDRYIRHDSIVRFPGENANDSVTPVPGDAPQQHSGNIEILSFHPEQHSRPNAHFIPGASHEVPRPAGHDIPVFFAGYDPELQPGYGHDEELEDKMDSYAVLDESVFEHSAQTYVTPATPTTVPTDIGARDDLAEFAPEKTRITKKLLDKPKKVMKVIKASSDGEYVPQEVPGVMLKTMSGEEEAFVPADLLEDTERLITSASDQQPSYVDPAASVPVSRKPPMRGMPYQFGWIVDDEATANYQTRQETGDSNGVVTGCYQVLDPNGVVRTVIYRADENGFRVLSLSRGPDKTPCPGLDDATRSPVPSKAPTPSPYSQSGSVFAGNTGSISNAQQGTFNQNVHYQSSSASASSSSQSHNSSSQSSHFGSFSGKNGLFEQPSYARTLGPKAQQSIAANQYNLQGSAQQAWMAEYLQNITKNLYSSFTNSSTVSNTNHYGGQSEGALVNFPFVLIPISTFLDLQKTGAIGQDIQSYGAFIEPQQGQAQLSQYLQQQQQQRQQQQQQKQKAHSETTHHTTFNTYNTTKSESQQKSQKSQGVNTVNYQGYGVPHQGRQPAKQVAQGHQYQSHQSSESAKSSSSSSSSSSNSAYHSNFAGNQGYPSGSQFNQAQPAARQPAARPPPATSYSSKPNPRVPVLSYGPPQTHSTQAPYVPQTIRPITQKPVVTRPPLPVPTPQPSQYRPIKQNIPQVQATQSYGPPPSNSGAYGAYSSQSSESSQQSASSQEKQASSSSSSFGGGIASQSYQSSSSKEAKDSKSSKASSSSQYAYNTGASGGAGSQYASQSKSSSSSSSSSSTASSSQKSFSSFSNAAGSHGAPNFLQTHSAQGFPGYPELRPSSSTAAATYVPYGPSQESSTLAPTSSNSIPKPALSKPVPQLSYQQPSPVVSAEANAYGSSSPSYNDDYDSSEPGPAFAAPVPEPNIDNTNSWIPLHDNTQENHQNLNIPGAYYGQNNVASTAATFIPAQQFNSAQFPQNVGGEGGNVFHYSSSSQSSQEQSSSQQNQQESSSSWSSSGAINPQLFFSKAVHQDGHPSQKQPRQLPGHQLYQVPS